MIYDFYLFKNVSFFCFTLVRKCFSLRSSTIFFCRRLYQSFGRLANQQDELHLKTHAIVKGSHYVKLHWAQKFTLHLLLDFIGFVVRLTRTSGNKLSQVNHMEISFRHHVSQSARRISFWTWMQVCDLLLSSSVVDLWH